MGLNPSRFSFKKSMSFGPALSLSYCPASSPSLTASSLLKAAWFWIL